MLGDRNNIFFNIIHYVLSEQFNVNWILKTSFINFTGLSSEVNYSKFQKPSLVNEILEYLTHVKPFHTKFDQFIEKYTSKNDTVNVQGDRRTTPDGEIIVIPNLVEFFDVTHQVRFDNVSGDPDIEAYNEINSSASMLDYYNTTSANRLYAYKTKDLELIKELLKCGFKGLTLEGGDFLIDAYGYDAVPYDSALYDAPTITNSYCIVDYNEPNYEHFNKEFIGVGINLLKTNYAGLLNRSKLKITSEYNGKTSEITDYNIINDTINIFYGIRLYEKVIITVTEDDNSTYSYIFVGIDFFEEHSESGNKEFSQYGNIAFAIPPVPYGLKSLEVYLENKAGSKYRITNYTRVDNNIVLDNIVDEFSRINITVVDYEYIYDKIYSYEDVYASGNNLMILDGEGFLRPHWEKNHPSELNISRVLNNIFIKKFDENNKLIEQNFIDYRNINTYADFNAAEQTILTKELNIGDTEIFVKNSQIFQQPSKNSDDVIEPGILLIEDEIIEFYEVNGNTLSKIKRACRGSTFKQSYPIDTPVYDFNTHNTIIKELPCKYIAYRADPSKLNYRIPGDILSNSIITVTKKERINMLTDLSPDSTFVDFDKPAITNPGKVIISYTIKDFFKVAKTDVMGIQLGINEPIIITFTKDIKTISDLVSFISKSIPSIYNLTVTSDGNTITFTSSRGESLLLYNLVGYPLQAIFDASLIGTKKNPQILMDGENGISINGRKIIWGTHKYTVDQLKANPIMGEINDLILSINKNVLLFKDINARNNSDFLELLSITGKNITLANIGKANSLTEIGIASSLEINDLISFNNNYNSIIVQKEKTSNPGFIEINDHKIYFYSYTEFVDNGILKSRIENIITDQTIKKEDAIILTTEAIELASPKDYIISDNNVVLKKPMLKYEALYITNNY